MIDPKADDAERPLSDKERQFCERYLVSLNATTAAEDVGYAKSRASRTGWDLLQRPRIQREVRRLMDERSARTQVDQDYVVGTLVEVVERCMQRTPVMTRVGPVTVQATDDDGRHVWTFDPKPAVSALNLLAQHLGMLTKRVQISGTIGTPPSRLSESERDRMLREFLADRGN